MWLMLTVSALMKPRKRTVKANLGYIVPSRLAQATESDLISKTNKVKQTKAQKSTLFGMRRCKSEVCVCGPVRTLGVEEQGSLWVIPQHCPSTSLAWNLPVQHMYVITAEYI